MDASTNFSLGFAQPSGVKAERSARAALQWIATGISLVSLAVGFSSIGILTIMKRGQADLSGISGGSSIAIVGGICAVLVGMVFHVTACAYLWHSLRRTVYFSIACPTARFSTAEPAAAIALLS